MNGLHGPKHKCSDMDREFNRFAGTRLEDLQGEIPALCKDQHGCRYLKKKLEEGSAEHKDMISHAMFGHFADLMTGMFSSQYEQRNIICDSVKQDLADARYNAQIHLIIVVLSLHVVVLIKDLNGNHVIKKCLNKLAPEDNQFIYNTVAAHCIEVATHRHRCCVLQRCIDHASDHQHIRLVNEITFNALTLVQDLYGNYNFAFNWNRTQLEKLLRDSYRNYRVQTGLDYAEPTQCALIVKGIRPLIRNTPDGKHIQNKLQREQMDHVCRGGYQHPQSLAPLGTQGVVPQGRHISSGHYSNGLSDIYVGQGGLYGQSGSQVGIGVQINCSLGPSSIDSYVLQGNSSHIGLRLTSSHHAGGLSGAPSAGISPFGGAGFTTSLSGNPYQRSFGGYRM
ncbi:armadillo-type protein [Mycena sanguinolenta]|nr:armadillo-type protein [Mycena sanguinolenta]